MKNSVKARLGSTAIILAAIQISVAAFATPQLDPTRTGSNVGVSSVKTVGTTTTVKQSAQSAILNWANLNTASNETLNFVQPSSSAVIVNEVRSGQVTTFQGQLNANGNVVIMNNAGVTFAAGSVVNVGALSVTTAKSVSHSGNVYNFGNISNTAVVNLDGTINASSDGYVYIMAQHIDAGTAANITAQDGNIVLQAGSQYYSVNLTNKTVSGTGNAPQGDITVAGNLHAGSGTVILRARANDLNSGFINLSGVVDTSNIGSQAAGNVVISGRNSVSIKGKVNNSGSKRGGTVKVASARDINVSGSIDNSSATGGNTTTITSHHSANLSGNINGSGAANSRINVATGSNLIIGELQVNNGTVNVSSGGTTTVNGFIDAQGYDTNSLQAKTPSFNAGNINIFSRGNFIANGAVDAGALNGIAGNINIKSNSNVTTDAIIAGGNININARKDINIDTPRDSDDYVAAYNGGPGTGGNITLKSGGSTNINTLVSTSNINGGGNVKITARNIADIDAAIITASANGRGGNINIKTSKIVFADDGDYVTSGALANGTVTVNGVAQ